MSDLISEIFIPKENANDDSIRIIEWFFKHGDYVKKGNIILEIETSKANIEIAAESEGFIEIIHSKGKEIPTNEIIGRIHTKEFSRSIAEEIDTTMVERLEISKEPSSDKGKKISNKAKLLLDKHNIDQNVFGDLDFVRERDILDYLNRVEKNDTIFYEKHENGAKKYGLLDEIKMSGKVRGKNLLWLMLNYIFRNWLLNLFVKISPVGVIIGVHRLRGVIIGRGCFIDPSAIVETAYPENIQIGNDVRITARAIIMTHIKAPNHLREKDLVPFVNKPVQISDHSFIGVGSIIMPGVTIGCGAVVASGAVVFNNVEPYTLVSGNPAKRIKNLLRS